MEINAQLKLNTQVVDYVFDHTHEIIESGVIGDAVSIIIVAIMMILTYIISRNMINKLNNGYMYDDDDDVFLINISHGVFQLILSLILMIVLYDMYVAIFFENVWIAEYLMKY